MKFESEQIQFVRSLSGQSCWPTVLLCIGSLGHLALGWWLVFTGSLGLGFGLNTLGTYLIYSCLHEAVHGNVSPKRWVNELVGYVSACFLVAPFQGFRYVHLKHHRMTNHQKSDSDFWSAKSGLFFRWVTQDFYYYYIFWRDRKIHSRATWILTTTQSAFLLLVVCVLLWAGQNNLLVFAWILPARTAVFLLSFTFNFLPHHPHDPSTYGDQIKGTVARPARYLDIILVGQNLHNIHHVFPSVPFYSYRSVWVRLGKELEKNGTKVHK